MIQNYHTRHVQLLLLLCVLRTRLVSGLRDVVVFMQQRVCVSQKRNAGGWEPAG